MATDATESEGSLKQTDTNNRVVNKSSSESDTPGISATLENKSSRVAEQGSDENAVSAACTPTEAVTSVGNGDQPVLSSPRKTGVQEESSQKEQSQESTRTHTALEHNGR